MAKRAHLEADSSETGEGSTDTGQQEGPTSWLQPRNYWHCNVTVRRRQHLTIQGYKPGDDSATYAITCLPTQILDFYLHKQADNWGAEINIFKSWPYVRFHTASITLSHFIPLQQSLQGSAQVDVTSFNIAPYMYIAEDNRGVIHTLPTPPITHSTFYKQQVQISSDTFWRDGPPNNQDEGLLACNKVQTLSANEKYTRTYNLQNHPYLPYLAPEFSTGTYTYLPGTYFPNQGFRSIFGRQQVTSGVVNVLGDTLHHGKIPPLFIFMPYIEPVSASESAPRLLGHVLLETAITMTYYTFADGTSQLITPNIIDTAANNSVPLMSDQWNSIEIHWDNTMY
ncbi:unnamed protein product [Schistosoma rodhaini]|nr:unnamed protein product [Schistosoma rodhaini]